MFQGPDGLQGQNGPPGEPGEKGQIVRQAPNFSLQCHCLIKQTAHENKGNDLDVNLILQASIILLTLSLPRVPKIKIQDKSQFSFCKILKYK